MEFDSLILGVQFNIVLSDVFKRHFRKVSLSFGEMKTLISSNGTIFNQFNSVFQKTYLIFRSKLNFRH